MKKEWITINLDKKEHFKQILELSKNEQNTGTPLTDTFNQILQCTYLKGILEEDKLISMILIHENDNNEGHIYNLATDNQYLRQGLASQLLTEARQTFNCLKLDVMKNNEPAITLYRKFGFVETEKYYDLLQNKYYIMEYSKIKPKMKQIKAKSKKFLDNENVLKEKMKFDI